MSNHLAICKDEPNSPSDIPPVREQAIHSDSRRGGTEVKQATKGAASEEAPHSQRHSQELDEGDRRGGAGGIGGGLKFSMPLVSLDDARKASFPEMPTTEFCETYQLGDDIQKLLDAQGFDTADVLLYANEYDLTNAGFKVGHIAELKWALKKIALEEFGTIETPKTEGESKPELFGGFGGAAGLGGKKHGVAGLGEGPLLQEGYVSSFSVLGGGVGGPGAGLAKGSEAYESYQAVISSRTTNQSNLPLLQGGIGGPGGWGLHAGGAGGLGQASQVGIEHVGNFGKIIGGFGGTGAGADRNKGEGGDGGTGEGNKFPKVLLPIDEVTRRWLPTTALKDFKIKPEHCEVLQSLGFQTVGGLFEVSAIDLAEHFTRVGDITQLTAALNKFVAKKPTSGNPGTSYMGIYGVTMCAMFAIFTIIVSYITRP
ncbi:hypothetical protein K438DRAFT_1831626 [Mycena galopus ATCC 62051]|nr:hypothetical protein K438DRAFT_1831626 [Mycena galopus ATCC 62051]